jgi:hypothetical protein
VLKIPVIADERRSGTSAAGLARAIEALAGEPLRLLPAVGEWTRQRLAELLEVVRSLDHPCPIIANVATQFFWGSRPPVATLLRYLDEGDSELGPTAEWSVGHFVLLVGTIDGRQGSLAIIADTYSSLGVAGVHLQPLERLARALCRPGLTEGGILLLCDAADAGRLSRAISEAGLEARLWDNGSLDIVGGS